MPETFKSEKRIRTRGKGAQFTRFIKPVVEVLRRRGGSGTVYEIIDQVMMLMNIPESEQAIKLKNGMSRVENQIHWARFYLVKVGLMDSSLRGIWRLTQKGMTIKLEEIDESAIFKEATNIFREAGKKKL